MNKKTIALFLFLGLGLVNSEAYAAAAEGGGLPMDGFLTNFANSVKGPWAYAISIIGIVSTAATLLLRGEEMGGFVRGFLGIILFISVIVLSAQILDDVTGVGAVIDAKQPNAGILYINPIS